VLRLRFGADLTQAEIGERLGVSQMQISRVMRRALKKLLAAVQDDGAQEDEASLEREMALAA
jgi:RNA polymerase sigma-B factor